MRIVPSDSESSSSEDFTSCSCEKYQYFKGLLEAGEGLPQALSEMEGDMLFEIAQWVAEELNADDGFDQFFGAFWGVYKTVLNADEQQEIEILYAIAQGAGEDLNPNVVQEFNQRLTAFLGDERQIGSIRTVRQAQNVAFALFGGIRSLMEHALTKHLARLFFVAGEGDIDVIKGAMSQLRALQVKYFTVNGFMERQVSIDAFYDAGEDNTMIHVWVATGRRCYKSYVEGQADGRFLFGSENPGMVVHTQKSEGLKEKAREIASAHFDDPVLLKIEVAQRYIFEDVEGKWVFIQSTGPLSVQSEESVPMVIEPLPRENLNVLYPKMAPELISTSQV